MRAMYGYALGGVLSRCRTAACGQKKIAYDFVSSGGLQPPNTEGLMRSTAPYHEHIGHARSAAKEHGSVKVAYDAIEHGSLIVCRR